MKKPLPPFGRHLKPDAAATCWVCVGSAAWRRAQSPEWMVGAKLMLPPGAHPRAFCWRGVAGFGGVWIVADGIPPSSAQLAALAGELWAYHPVLLYLDPDGCVSQWTAPSDFYGQARFWRSYRHHPLSTKRESHDDTNASRRTVAGPPCTAGMRLHKINSLQIDAGTAVSGLPQGRAGLRMVAGRCRRLERGHRGGQGVVP